MPFIEREKLEEKVCDRDFSGGMDKDKPFRYGKFVTALVETVSRLLNIQIWSSEKRTELEISSLNSCRF
jgi:hypothetical protein